MTNRTAAIRYARALFDVSLAETADLPGVARELVEIRDLLRQFPDLEKVLFNPAVPAPRKRALVSQLVDRIRPQVPVGKLLLLLAERDRLVLLSDLPDAFRDRLQQYQNIVRAEVTTAQPVDSGRAKAIEASLAKATGRTIALSTRVDPTIIGGMVARVGSTVYDGSVTNHLQRMKQRLEESI